MSWLRHKHIHKGAALLTLWLGSASFCLAYPTKVISLGPAITKQIYLLDAQDRLVGVTTYCRRPPQAQEKEKIGTILDVNVEKIVALKPDLVLAISLTSQKDVAKLKALGIKVVRFPRAESFVQICEQFLKLSAYLGEKEKAKRIVSEAKARVKLLKEKVENLPKIKVFIQIGTKPLITVGRDSFFNDLIEFAGGINIAQASGSGIYSREMVLKNNPDVIIITTMGLAGEAEKKIWQNYQSLKAVQNNRIYIVDEYKFCSMTPADFTVALAEMVNILYP